MARKNPCKCTYAEPMPVDSCNKATEIRFLSLRRPHMRGFWASTFAFFMAFIGWFAMAPLMTTIMKDLHLTKDQVYNSNILAVAATIPARFVVGPLCDRYGPRWPMAITLLLCALPLGCAALIQDATGLYVVRFLIGFAGATFVPCQYWTTAMFTGKIVGSANALAGGWGNLGGGVTQAFTIGMFDMFKALGCGVSMAWRMSLVVPAVGWVLTAILIFFLADDCPHGKWQDRPQTTATAGYSLGAGLKEVLTQPFTYFLIVAYACGFGVELHVNKTIAAYFESEWQLDTSTAGLIATLSGLMNLFSRAMGGWLSDRAARRWFLRGRMLVIVAALVLSGAFLCILSSLQALWAAILLLVIFSIFCQASCGAVYGLVPFVSTQYGGIVSGLVGGGGNLGAMCWGFLHKAYGLKNDESTSYLIIGFIAMASSLLLFCGRLHGAALLPCLGGLGQEREEELSRTKCDILEKDEESPSEDSTTKAKEEEEEIASFEAAYVMDAHPEVPSYHSADNHLDIIQCGVAGVPPSTPVPACDGLVDFHPTPVERVH